jgi:tetratricopeptide (TPR) repeat protein
VDESPPPRGSLDAWPLPALFVHVVDHRLSGSLALQSSSSGDLDVVVFAEGAPIRARTAKLVAPLGEMLVRYGVIADVDLASALARASTAKAKLGQQLIAEKVIDRRVLLRALRDQLLLRVRSIAALPATTKYEFHSNNDLLDEGAPTGATPVDPLSALLALVRRWPDRARMDARIVPLLEVPVKAHDEATFDRFELEEAERAVLDRALASGGTYGSTLRSTLAPEVSIRAMLYTLLLTHHLDDGSGKWPLDVEAPSTSLRDSSLNAGIEKERTSQVMRALSAAEHHREASVLIKAGNLEAAEKLAARSVEMDGSQPEYRALLGFIVASLGDVARGEALLDRAIADAPRSDRALVLRAKVREESGRDDDALVDYKAALALNASNAEAARAVRIALGQSGRWSTTGDRARVPSPRPPPIESSPQREKTNTGWWLVTGLLLATIVMLLFYVVKMR